MPDHLMRNGNSPKRIVVLSPHFDDAVLSCWHLLTGAGDVTVANVFTAMPAAGGRELFWWDAQTGATASRARVRERRAEDRAALALAGCRALQLGFLDGQYRSTPQPLGPLIERCRMRLPAGATVYAPAAIRASVADHATVRDAALALVADGFDVRLYADLPHAIQTGWPGWVTGDGATRADVHARWRRQLDAVGVDLGHARAEPRRLDDTEFAAKLAALETYATQWPYVRKLAPVGALRYELTFAAGDR